MQLRLLSDDSFDWLLAMNPRAWIHRRYYPSAVEALSDAERVVSSLGDLYIVKHTNGPPEYWQNGEYWTISEQPPFHGKAGIFYHPLPEHYLLLLGQFVHVPGEET